MRRIFTSKLRTTLGFSIIEILAAITFLTVGIFAIAKIFPFGIQISQNAEDRTIAATLAQDKIEELISSGYEGIAIGIIEAKQEIPSGSFGDKYNFYRQTIVSFVDGDLADSVSDTGMKKIEVTVFWNSGGNEKNLVLKRLISRR